MEIPESLNSYYYLVSSLKELILDYLDPSSAPTDFISFAEFRKFAEDELDERDYTRMMACFLLNDVDNVMEAVEQGFISAQGEPGALRREISFESYRTPCLLDSESLIQGIRDPGDDLLPFLTDFLHDMKMESANPEDSVSAGNSLLSRLFSWLESEQGSLPSFTVDYLRFEMQIRNLAVALSRRKQERDYREHVQIFDDFYQKIVTSRALDFGIGGELGHMTQLVEAFQSDNPVESEKAIISARWNWLDERIGTASFSAEAVSGYAVKLADLERWHGLRSDEKGNSMDVLIDSLLEGLEEKIMENY